MSVSGRAPYSCGQVVGRLDQLLARGGALEGDDLVRDLAVHRHDHDQHAAAIERDELDPLQQALGGRRPGEADVLASGGPARARHGRALRASSRPAAAGPRRPGPACRAASLHQPVDVLPVAEIGGDASGRRVRLLDEALFLEPGQDVADRGRRDGAAGVPRQPLRRDGLAVLDVLAHQRAEQAEHTIRQFRRRVTGTVRHVANQVAGESQARVERVVAAPRRGLAVSPRDC